ncbi:MAG TPA: hypothetical protein VFW40_12310 [Capsulimonadaceae bacterium]|nr:hypothetical protein [Capsulimonadaceae bacterium]
MKRASSVFLLGIALLAAVLLVNQVGLFKRPPSPPVVNGPGVPGGPSQTVTPINPPTVTEGPGRSPALPPVPQGEYSKALRDWTYPGAVPARDKSWMPASAQKPNGVAHNYVRFLEAYAPPGKVWRFYREKAGVDPGPGNPASQLLGPMPGGQEPVSQDTSLSAGGITMGHYSRIAKDFMISAMLVYRADIPNRTQILLQIIPTAGTRTIRVRSPFPAFPTSPLTQQ